MPTEFAHPAQDMQRKIHLTHYSAGEERINIASHAAGLLLSVAGLVALVTLALRQGDAWHLVSFAIYGASLVLLFAASTAYHGSREPARRARLRTVDHASIYLLIAGTYTPICLFYLPGAWRTALLVTIWALAAVGITVKLFIINAPRWVTAGVYLLMGWLGVIAAGEMLSQMPAGALFWLVAGGLFFSVGAVVYITRRPNPYPGRFGFHEIWHIFVVLGAFSHFVIMAAYIAPLG